MGELVLEVRGLRVVCASGGRTVVAVDGLDLALDGGEFVGLIGESGCGKTTTVRSLIGLTERNCRVVAGEVWFRGRRVRDGEHDELARIRGRHVGFIFQNATASLNPLLTVGRQIDEVLRVHARLTSEGRRATSRQLLGRLGFSDVESVQRAYPHQLSGGMRQRAAIAIATVCEPDILVADECTSALDVTTQAEVIALLRTVCRERGMALLFVTHDILLASELCSRLAVMYAGQIVEEGRVPHVLAAPRHPYTQALVRSLPSWGPKRVLAGIDGMPPVVSGPTIGCRFAPRCVHARPPCTQGDVPWTPLDRRDGYRCVRAHELRIEPSGGLAVERA